MGPEFAGMATLAQGAAPRAGVRSALIALGFPGLDDGAAASMAAGLGDVSQPAGAMSAAELEFGSAAAISSGALGEVVID